MDKHFARTFNEYNSPVTTHATGPHEQAKKKMSKKKNPFRQHCVNQAKEEEEEEEENPSISFSSSSSFSF